MWFKSVGYFLLLLLTEGLTALLGIIFVAVAWATYLDAREQGQEARPGALYTFTFAALPNVLALLSLWFGPSDFSPFVSSWTLLVLSWVFLVATLFVSRGNPGREIATIKVGCFVLLAIGGFGLVLLNVR